MAKHILLVDGNSIAHANHNGTKLTVGGMQVQAIFGTLKSLHALLKTTPGQKELLVLWDGKAQFRLDLFPEYKGNRKALDEEQAADKAAFKRQTPFIEKSLELLGVRQMRSPLLEADDLAGHLIPRLVAQGRSVTMVSGDKDWLQMVGENVTWFDPIRDRKCDTDNFLDFTGYFSPESFVHGKALQGDSSDNVPGIPWMGEKGAQVFMAQWKDVSSFFAAVDSGTHTPKVSGPKATRVHPETFLASPEGRAVFERNVKLMDWSLSRKPGAGELIINPGAFSPEKFEALCQRLAFASILRELNMILKTFNPQYIKETI
jgi:5'-3' exonuclease